MPLIEVPQSPLRPGENDALAVPLARIAGEVTAENRIGTDVPCRRCGYNLRGLHIEAKCPECALPAWPSLRPGLVGFGEPRFIDFLRRGALLLVIGLPLVFGGAIIMGRFGRTFFLPVPPASWPLDLVWLLGVAASLLGCWVLTTPDPSGLGEVESGGLRKAARVVLLVGAFVLPLATLREISSPSGAAAEVLDAFEFGFGLAAVAGMFLMLRFLRRMAFRLFEPVLARQMSRISYQLLGCAAGAAVTGVALVAVLRPFVPPLAAFMFNLRPFVYVAALVTVPQAAYGCWRLANELAAHAKLARQSWPENDAACTAVGGGDLPPAS